MVKNNHNNDGHRDFWDNVPDQNAEKLVDRPDEADIAKFSQLFAAVTDDNNPNLAAAIEELRNFVNGARARYQASANDLAQDFLAASDLPVREDHNHIWRTFQNLSRTLPEEFGKCALISKPGICQAGRLFMDANKRCPTPEDGLILRGNLADGVRTWKDVADSIAPLTLGEFFCRERVFVYRVNFKGVLTHDMIVNTVRAKIAAGKGYPASNDVSPIAVGELAATGISFAGVNSALWNGTHGLPGRETLQDVLKKADMISPRERIVTYEEIIATGWAVKLDTKRRMTMNDGRPIMHGPLRGSELTGKILQSALYFGHHGLPGGRESLSGVQDAAGIPGKYDPIIFENLPPLVAAFVRSIPQRNWAQFNRESHAYLLKIKNAQEERQARELILDCN